MNSWMDKLDAWGSRNSTEPEGQAAGPVVERTPEQRQQITALKVQLAGYVMLFVGMIAAAVVLILLVFG